MNGGIPVICMYRAKWKSERNWPLCMSCQARVYYLVRGKGGEDKPEGE